MDLDGDGVNDILSGSYSRMEQSMAGLFQVLWGKDDGTFKTAEVLKGTDSEPLIIPIASKNEQTENICTRPTAVDWDSDGDLDLIVGNFSGTFYLFSGKGKAQFDPKPELIKAGDEPLRIEGVHSDPFVVDWDQDGDLDVLSGSSNGGVYWAENTAGAKQPPQLKPFATLIEPNTVAYGQPVSEDELKGPTSATRVYADDVNGDGKLDILVGDNVTLVAPARGISAKAFAERFAAWQEAVQQASDETRAGTATGDQKKQQEAMERFRKLYAQRSEFMSEERTGFVWLYVQK